MEINDFADGELWGILPDRFDSIIQLYLENRQYFVENSDKIEAALSKSGRNNDEPDYEVTDGGVAIVSITGTISKRDTFWSMLFGGVSVESISRDYTAAIDDSSVDSIVLNIDSPGGTIGGIEGLSNLIAEKSLIKPTVTYGDSLLASAAYWIGSGASKIMAERTAIVGSIGVMTVHYDFSKNDEQAGVKRTYLTAGKYKALGNDAEPLSTFAKEYIQERLDYFYTMFVNSVAENRNTNSERVLADMADGKVFIGTQAQDAGLIDGVGRLEDAIELAEKLSDQKKESFSLNLTGGIKMKFKDIEQMVAAYPEYCKEIHDKGAASIDTTNLKTEAVTDEQNRIFGFAEVFMGEADGKKFREIVESGMTAEQYKIVVPENPKAAATEAEADLKATMLDAIKNAGAEDPGHDNSQTTESSKDFNTLVAEYKAMNKSTQVEAMQAVQKAHPDKHMAYLKSVN